MSEANCTPPDAEQLGTGNMYSLCFSERANLIYGACYIIGTFFSFIGNFLAIGVWGSYLKNYLTVLYLNLSVCDFVLAVTGSTTTTISLFSNRNINNTILESPVICTLQGMLFELCANVTGNIISILCIARWYSFAHPFEKIKRAKVLRVIAVAWVYNALPHIGFTISALMKFTDTKYRYHPAVSSCILRIYEKLPPWLIYTLVIMFAILPTLLNSLIIPVTSVLVVKHIIKQSNQHAYYSISKERKHLKYNPRAGSAVTVAVVAIVFLLCQLPLWAWQYADVIDGFLATNIKGAMSPATEWNTDFVLYNLLINVNATLNPYLYYVRGSQYRGLLRQKLKHISSRVTGYQKIVKFKLAGRGFNSDHNHKSSNSSLEVEY